MVQILKNYFLAQRVDIYKCHKTYIAEFFLTLDPLQSQRWFQLKKELQS